MDEAAVPDLPGEETKEAELGDLRVCSRRWAKGDPRSPPGEEWTAWVKTWRVGGSVIASCRGATREEACRKAVAHGMFVLNQRIQGLEGLRASLASIQNNLEQEDLSRVGQLPGSPLAAAIPILKGLKLVEEANKKRFRGPVHRSILTHAVYALDPTRSEDRCYCDHCGKVGTMLELMEDDEPCPAMVKKHGPPAEGA